MTMIADTDTTTTMRISILMLLIHVHTISMPIIQTTMGLVYLAMIMPVITRIQIRIPPIPTTTVSTTVLIATAMLVWHLHSRIRIHNSITTMNDKRVNLRIPTLMYMSIPTDHILIPTLHLLMWNKSNIIRSLPRSEDENLILVAHHYKLLPSKIINHQPQFKFHFRCHLLWIRRSPLIIPAHSSMTTILSITTMMLVTDLPPTPMGTIMLTKATVITCVGYSYT